MFNLINKKSKEKIKITTTKPEISPKVIIKRRLFDNTNFSEEQKKVLYEAIEKKLPYQLIEDIDYSAEKMRILLKCMEEDIDIYRYVNPRGYNAKQLEEIYDGIKKNLDIYAFANEYISATEMRKIKIGLEDNINLSNYMSYPEDILYEIKLFLKEKLYIDDYLNGDYNANQLKEIRLGLLSGIDVSIYTSNEYSSEHMRLIRKVLEVDGDIEPLADPSLDLQVVVDLAKHQKEDDV